jgi:hypothetical protein
MPIMFAHDVPMAYFAIAALDPPRIPSPFDHLA